MTTPTPAQIARLSDQGLHAPEIAKRLQLSASRVYAVLQSERPDRPRKPRGHSSVKRRQILALHAKHKEPTRIAALLGVSRQYVHKVLGEAS